MFLITINKSVPEMSIPLLTGGAAAPFAPIGLPPMILWDIVLYSTMYWKRYIVYLGLLYCKVVYITVY